MFLVAVKESEQEARRYSTMDEVHGGIRWARSSEKQNDRQDTDYYIYLLPHYAC
jgi:hypothetical protein